MKNQCANCQSENNLDAKYCADCGNILPVKQVSKGSDVIFESKPKKQTNSLLIVIFVVCFWAAFFGIRYLVMPSENDKLKVITKTMNNVCPIKFDEYTILRSVVLLPNKTIQYNYTLSELTKAEINIDTVKKYVYLDLLKKAKESPEAKPIRDLNATLKHHYVDKNGELIVEYVITPEMYK